MEGKKLILGLLTLSLLFIVVTISFYLYKFGSLTLSGNNDDWVDFSNYFSGILNPILTLLNLIIFAYLSFKLVKIEDDRNNWTLQELARPYANFVNENRHESIEITIHNVGLGPMILTDFRILKNSGKIYKNFYDLVNDITNEENMDSEIEPKIDSFEIRSGSGAIAKDQSHCIFKLYFTEVNQDNRNFVDLIRNRLNEYTISITYSDMYGKEIECMREDLNFASWND
jgi:hypothetical protein